jgi:hypothetical protein
VPEARHAAARPCTRTRRNHVGECQSRPSFAIQNEERGPPDPYPAPAAAAQKIGRVGPGWLKVICDLLGGTYNDYPGTGLYECLLPGGPWVMCDPTDCHIVRTEPPREDVVIRTEYGLYIVPADGGPITFPAVPDPDRAG